jgi:hypothetical protein
MAVFEFTQMIEVQIGQELHQDVSRFMGVALTGEEITHAASTPPEVLTAIGRLTKPIRLRATFSLDDKGVLSITGTEPA